MLIRPQQMQTLEENCARAFENRTIDYLIEHFPDKCNAIGSENVRELVRFGRMRAAARYIYGERGIVMYLHFMFALGSYFDLDPLYPWAAQALNDYTITEEPARLAALWNKAEEYNAAVLGTEGEHLDRVLKTLREAAGSWPPPFVGGPAEDYVASQLKDLYPEKAAFVGDDCMKLLIETGLKSAARYRLTNKSGISVYTTLMFMLGASFDSDPQYPWAAEILRNDDFREPSEKAARLFERAVKYLDLFIAPEPVAA